MSVWPVCNLSLTFHVKLQANFDSSSFKADEEVAKLLHEIVTEHNIKVQTQHSSSQPPSSDSQQLSTHLLLTLAAVRPCPLVVSHESIMLHPWFPSSLAVIPSSITHRAAMHTRSELRPVYKSCTWLPSCRWKACPICPESTRPASLPPRHPRWSAFPPSRALRLTLPKRCALYWCVWIPQDLYWGHTAVLGQLLLSLSGLAWLWDLYDLYF